jgi:hypothetical protein
MPGGEGQKKSKTRSGSELKIGSKRAANKVVPKARTKQGILLPGKELLPSKYVFLNHSPFTVN